MKKTTKLKKKSDSCEKCKLYEGCINPKMKYTGKGLKKILVIGEAPGAEEDKLNKQFIGKSGQFLRERFAENGFDFEEDCWITNAIICRPPKNKTPITAQINYCRYNLQKTIKILNPEKIITFGSVPLQGLIGDKISVTNFTKWTGWQIPDQDYECYIFPNFHPAYLLRNQKDKVLRKRFDYNLKTALKWKKTFKKEKINIKICDDKEAIFYLRNLDSLQKETIAIDYETTGLKPHREGHEILCVSITDLKLNTFVFMVNDITKPYLMSILENENIGKIAHNVPFENKWSNWLLEGVENWIWDTKIACHSLDNRKKTTGLKFQGYVNFGVVGYDEEAKEYIEAKKKGANEFNRMKEMDPKKMMEYCGYDTYLTMKLYLRQAPQFDEHLKKGKKLFLDGSIVLSELAPIRFDYEKYEEHMKNINTEVNDLHEKIMSSKEIKKWDGKEVINYNSDKQLRELLFKKCGWDSENKTKTGLESVDKITLKEFNRKFTNNILKRRKLVKIRDTYLAQFAREAVILGEYYYIYPFFDLTIPTTYRSSSYNPNFQNVPKRDKLSQSICRSTMIPSPGNRFLELDFKGMEVSTSCCYHHDPVMIDYVENPKNDMHRDVCMELFLRTLDTYTKDERHIGKNGFVFPSFYGSTCRIHTDEDKKLGTGEITRNIWDMLIENTKDHLAKNGISNIYYFQEHIEKIEDYFWKVRFKEYQNWKWENWRNYKKKGYIELKTGFRCNSIMGFNDVNNYPIQGAAFHILLNCLIKLHYYFKENDIKSKIVGQIHDSIIIDLVPEEMNHVIGVMKRIIEQVRKEWDWIIVPLVIEAEITEIDGSWDQKKEIKI
jgi:uracil-DNA glycosylase family 4